VPRAPKALKDGIARDAMTALRMPTDLKEWLMAEAARRSLATRKRVTASDIMIGALRKERSAAAWRKARVS
jgi:hypothetical protein